MSASKQLGHLASWIEQHLDCGCWHHAAVASLCFQKVPCCRNMVSINQSLLVLSEHQASCTNERALSSALNASPIRVTFSFECLLAQLGSATLIMSSYYSRPHFL